MTIEVTTYKGNIIIEGINGPVALPPDSARTLAITILMIAEQADGKKTKIDQNGSLIFQ